jgi:nucleotide-binding universal stress UspA family protein
MLQPKYLIVVGIDYSAASERALDEALALGSSKYGVQLHVVNVRPAPSDPTATDEVSALPPWRYWAIELQEYVARKVAAFRATAGTTPFQHLYTHQRMNDPVEQLTELATNVNADLLIVGTHDWRKTAGAPAHSVAEGVTRLARCPVLVVHRHGSPLTPPLQYR